MGMASPRTGAPSMISNLVMVSLSLYKLGPADAIRGHADDSRGVGGQSASGEKSGGGAGSPEPVDSRRIMASSMCLILMRTRRKKIFPNTTSLR